MIREDFLQQNAFHKVDTYCSLKKQYLMLKAIMKFYERAATALKKGKEPEEIMKASVVDDIAKMKFIPEEKFEEKAKKIFQKINQELE